ncbi:MAG: CoA ester lyase, partial [Hyphomicrobiales bacterium]
VPGRTPMLPALMQCLFAARAHGLDILDGVYNNFNDADGFARECAQARDMGFDGKTLIHPSQIEPCNAAFTPADDDVSAARAILAAFEKPENSGKGVIQINGQMVERLHAEMAKRTVSIADGIAARR